jgi:hypothetical protein
VLSIDLCVQWEHKIKMDLEEMECESVDCIHLSQGRDQWGTFVILVKNFWFHKWCDPLWKDTGIFPERLFEKSYLL